MIRTAAANKGKKAKIAPITLFLAERLEFHTSYEHLAAAHSEIVGGLMRLIAELRVPPHENPPISRETGFR
jgi:hypothetical protein